MKSESFISGNTASEFPQGIKISSRPIPLPCWETLQGLLLFYFPIPSEEVGSEVDVFCFGHS